jgi:hypothetical protein
MAILYKPRMAQESVKTDPIQKSVKQFVYSPAPTIKREYNKKIKLDDTNAMTELWNSSGQKGNVTYSDPIILEYNDENNRYSDIGVAPGKYLYGIRNMGDKPVTIKIGQKSTTMEDSSLIAEPGGIYQIINEVNKAGNFPFVVDSKDGAIIRLIKGTITNSK